MSYKKVFGISLVLTLLFAGAFALARGTSLGNETVARNDALSNVLSPVGLSAADEVKTDTSLSDVADAVASMPVRDMPPNEYHPEHDQYLRWLNGEIDVDFEGIPPAMRPFLLEQAMNLPVSVRNAANGGGPTLLGGFDSIDSNDCCGGGTVVPPDPELAVGPNHAIAAVNLALEIYDKTGTSLSGPVTYATFFNAMGAPCTGGFDPNVLYDESADRFIIGVDSDGGVSYCVAVSQTGDPMGAYNMYEFDSVDVGGTFFDYPHAGVGDDALYMGANLFGSGQGWMYAMDKAAMYAGGAATIVMQQLNAGHETPQPANLHGWDQGTWPTGGPHYIFAGTAFSSASNYALYSWDDPFGANTFTLEGTYNLPAIHGVSVGSPVGALQQGGSSITGNDPRPLDFEYRNGSAWTAMTVSCNPGGGTVNCIQWAEVDLATQTIAQTDVIASSGEYRYFPDFAVDHCGNAFVGYTRSSSTSFPSVYAAGPVMAGVNPGETLVKAGETTYSAFADRWGDYTGMTIDPDGRSAWYLGEYSKDNGNTSANWANWIGNVTLDCNTGANFGISASPNTQDVCIPNDAIYDIDISQFGGFTDPVTLSASGVPAGYTAGFSTNPVIPAGTSVMTLSGSGAASAGNYSIDVVGMAPTSTQTTTVDLNLFDAAATVSLVAPADGAIDQPLSPSFSWTGTGTSYTIDIATDMAFTNIVETATVMGTSYMSGGLAGNTTYYWRVSADNVCGSAVSSTWSFTTVDLQCSTPGVDIPDDDPNGVTDEFMIGDTGTINDLDVSVMATHTWVGDLIFTLEHVDTGTSVTFYDQPGVPASTFGCAGDDVDATLDDEAGTNVEDECGAGTPTIAGSFIPNNALSAFDGEDQAGTWRITASDNAGGDTGSLDAWCVNIITPPPTDVQLSGFDSVTSSVSAFWLLPLLALLGLAGYVYVARKES